MKHEALCIEARLGSPFVGEFTAPLDGILTALACAEAYGQMDAYLPGEKLPFDPEIVPIQIVENGEEWFYAATFAMWGAFVEGQDHWNKRLDDGYADRTKANSVVIGAGPYKNYHYRITYRHSTRMRWYCIGNKAEIEYLLPECHHIGKKGSQGWGHVLEWRVRAADIEQCLFNNDGFPMRTIPVSYLNKNGGFNIVCNLGQRAYRPPYWATENMGWCAVP